MPLWAQVTKGIPVLLDTLKPLIVNDVQYVLDIYKLAEENRAGWSIVELEKLGVYRVNETPVPSGKYVISTGLEFTGAAVNRTYVYGDEIPVPVSRDEVNTERDRRISSGFDFNGVRYQSRQGDRENIAGAGTLAAVAIMGGAQPGDLRWHGGVSDFVWIAQDNSLVSMDAYTVIEFGKAAAQWKSANIFAAKAVKDLDPIPVDYTSEKYWP